MCNMNLVQKFSILVITMQVKKLTFDTEVRYLKGVGPRKADVLARIGIRAVGDLVYYLPRRYEDRRDFTLIKDLKPGEYKVVRGKVLTVGSNMTKKGMSVFRIALADATGVIYCVWFNQPFLRNVFEKGMDIIVYGKAEKYDRLRINHPDYEIVKDGSPSINMGRIVPVYPLTEEVTQKYLRMLIREATETSRLFLRDSIPVEVRARKRLADMVFAVRNIHFPGSFENLDKAYRRIVFEEFFMLQLALALKRKKQKEPSRGIAHKMDAFNADDFKKLLDFELTLSQKRSIKEIERDMISPKPMNRLLEGDVGSGKTVVAMYALMLSVKSGYQCGVMAPTEILARQHYINMSEFFMPLGINIRLLVGGIDKDKKEEIKEEIKSAQADIVIGTHALIWENVDFKDLGLVVIDEQHKFGVTQRELLRKKGERPDTLVMTATPIPRTLALTIYGDLDISVIKELPGGRLPITTYALTEDKREKAYEFLREEIKKGRQAYIVYPRIEETSADPGNEKHASRPRASKSASHMHDHLRHKIFPDLKLALIHGRMKPHEKDAIMKKFKENKINILVSTTVIEVGIDIPNASLMIIEHAEMFGLSQLHQLRGRIGRGEYSSCCILLGSPATESARKRFYTMTETQDGFKVAEDDLEMRGPGEFFGTKQHGLPEIRFGNIIKDFGIMEEARSEAFRIVKEDPLFKDTRHKALGNMVKKRFDLNSLDTRVPGPATRG